MRLTLLVLVVLPAALSSTGTEPAPPAEGHAGTRALSCRNQHAFWGMHARRLRATTLTCLRPVPAHDRITVPLFPT